MDSINDRLNEIIDVAYQGNKRAFSKAVGISPTVIQNVVGARKNKPSFDVIYKICANANISESWLISGLGPMRKTKGVQDYNTGPETPSGSDKVTDNFPVMQEQSSAYGEVSGRTQRLVDVPDTAPASIPGAIPLVNERAIGGLSGESFSISERDIKDYYVVPKFRGRNVDFLIEVAGHSMEPHIYPGDIIACSVVRGSKIIQWGNPYLLATRDDGLIVKRLRKGDDDSSVKAVSDNPEFDPFTIPRTDIISLARVVGIIHAE